MTLKSYVNSITLKNIKYKDKKQNKYKIFYKAYIRFGYYKLLEIKDIKNTLYNWSF